MRSAILFIVFAACGARDARPDAMIAITDAAPTPDVDICFRNAQTCNPVFQIGCDTGERCTWVRVELGSSGWGEIGCVPTGTAQVGAACTWGPHGTATGYDDCATGLLCDAPMDVDRATGTCVSICDASAQAGTTGACETALTCQTTVGVFWNAGCPASVVGVCVAQ